MTGHAPAIGRADLPGDQRGIAKPSIAVLAFDDLRKAGLPE